MAIILRDILVTIEEADYSFKNPVSLTNESSETIGHAELEHRSDRIYATLHFEQEETAYLDAYPKLTTDAQSNSIQSIVLSHTANNDVRIERIKDQELFQSSTGADHAEMQ